MQREIEMSVRSSTYPSPPALPAARPALHHKLQRKLLLDERAAIIDLRDRGVINDDAMRHVQGDLDLEELLLEEGTTQL